MPSPPAFDRVRTVITEIQAGLCQADALYWAEDIDPAAQDVDARLRSHSTFDFRFGALRPRDHALDPFELQMQRLVAAYHPPRLLELQRYVLGEIELVAAVMSAIAKPVGSAPLPDPRPSTRWWFVERDSAWRVVAWQILDEDTTPPTWRSTGVGDDTVDVMSLGEPTDTLPIAAQ